MSFVVGAKSTKPGSKANSRGKSSPNGKPARVPVGMLHFIDPDNQSATGAMFDAVCGESHLVTVDDEWDGPLSNERCEVCADAAWAVQFDELQRDLLQ